MAAAATKTKAPVKKAATKSPSKAVAPVKEKVIKKAAADLVVLPTPSLLTSKAVMADFYRRNAEAFDKSLDLVSGRAIMVDPISSGSLVVDWVLNGGFPPILNQVSGMEQAGKTTLILSTLAQAYRVSPLIEVYDAEGTMSPEYAGAMFRQFDLADLFKEGGTVRYYQNDVLEDFSDKMSKMLNAMPDKVWVEEAGTWAYTVKKGGDKRAKALTSYFDEIKLKADKALSKDSRWFFPTDYSGPEGVVFLDSWPQLITRGVDEEGRSGQMAQNATPLSKELVRFAGKLKRRGVPLISVNQIRENPGQRYGSPLYEPGGNTLKHATGMRLRMFSAGVPDGFDKDPDNGAACYEDSVRGDGYDYYAFKNIQNTKHKLGRPFLKGQIRIWTSDAKGKARGIDPFYDTWVYLKKTGQIRGNKKSFKFKFRKSITAKGTLALQDFDWDFWTLKRLVIAEHFGYKDVATALVEEMGLTAAPHLRESLFKQLRTDLDLWGTDVDDTEGEEDYEEVSDDE